MKTHDDLTNWDNSKGRILNPITGQSLKQNPYPIEDWPGNEHQCPVKNTAGSCDAYQCPVKCEGEKTYDKPGKCPYSGLDLIPAGGGYIFY